MLSPSKMLLNWQIYCLVLVRLACAANPTVSLTYGTVVGTTATVLGQPTAPPVNAFLGMPYAQSPPLRFAPAVLPKQMTKPLLAQHVAPACLQFFPSPNADRVIQFFGNPGHVGLPAESEDCLYLNVWAPQDASPSNRKAVLFSIFGGGYNFGTGSIPLYNGSSLAATQDVLVVTFNFRTNIFGFPGSPEVPAGQKNLGILDQRLALEWVQQNIAAFGGDPTRVTIMGQSSGSDSVMQLLAQPPSPLPFHGAIIQSAGVISTTDSAPSWAKTIKNFQCSDATSPLACMRGVSATAIHDYINAQNLLFQPVVDNVYTTNPKGSIVSKQWADVPVLFGTTAQEASIYLAVFGQASGPMYTMTSHTDTQAFFLCPTSALGTALTVGGYRAWRYLYSPTFANIDVFNCPSDGCAYHSSELYEVFGTYPLVSPFGLGAATSNQVQLSKYMQGVWAGWATNPSKGPGWPRLGTNFGNELGNIGTKAKPNGVIVQSLASQDYICPGLAPIGDFVEIWGSIF